jgi:hypothetical protein
MHAKHVGGCTVRFGGWNALKRGVMGWALAEGMQRRRGRAECGVSWGAMDTKRRELRWSCAARGVEDKSKRSNRTHFFMKIPLRILRMPQRVAIKVASSMRQSGIRYMPVGPAGPNQPLISALSVAYKFRYIVQKIVWVGRVLGACAGDATR